jgi:hypothetical protein
MPWSTAQECAAAQSAQQQLHQAQGGWRPMVWKRQLPPPWGSPQGQSRGARRSEPWCRAGKQAKNLMPSPLRGAPNVKEEIFGRVAECTYPKS